MGAAIAGQIQITSQYVDQGTTPEASLKVGVVISDTTVAAPAASIDITSIPTGYKWFQVFWRGSCSNALLQNLQLKINNDGGNEYDYCFGAVHVENSPFGVFGVIGPTGVPVTANGTITNVAASTKEIVGVYFVPAVIASAFSTRYHAAAPAEISRITLTPAAGNVEAGSRFTVMGWK